MILLYIDNEDRFRISVNATYTFCKILKCQASVGSGSTIEIPLNARQDKSTNTKFSALSSLPVLKLRRGARGYIAMRFQIT